MPSPKMFQTGAMQIESGLSGLKSTIVVTIDAVTDIFTSASDHGMNTGDAFQIAAVTTMPDPLVALTDYYATVIDATTFKAATNRAHALNNINIDMIDDGTGEITLRQFGISHTGWGDTNAAMALGANDAFPWLGFGHKFAIETAKDESVITRSFESGAKTIAKKVENPISYHARFKGMNRFHYWMFGFENLVRKVVVFRAGANPWATATPVVGDACKDVDLNEFYFLRTEQTRTEKLYVFEAVTVAPTLQTGVITETVGTPKWTFTFTSHSGILYEHLYELDSYGRHLRSYTTAERALLTLAVNDKRNLMCTLGKRMESYDLRYKNAMSKNFNFKCSAAGLASWEGNYVAYDETRGDYSSSVWTLLTGLDQASLIPAHFEYMFKIGETITVPSGELTGLTEIALSEFGINVEPPTQTIQDTVSGLAIAEPVLEGKYALKMNATISRHSVQTYQTFRDAGTELCAHLVANYGWYMQEFMIKKCRIVESGANEDNVAAEPLSLEIDFDSGTSNFSDWLTRVTEMHESPLLFRVRDDSQYNEMIRY
jgi:hypothetical protein